MNYVVNKIVNLFISNKLIKKEDEEIYSYGLKQGFIIIINFITVIILGISLNILLEGLLFMITFIPIRIYAGGYHKRSQLECYVFSTIILAVIFLILKMQIIINPLTIILISIISSITILSLAPVQDENKPLDEIEIKIFGKRARTNLLIILGIFLITLIFDKINYSFCIAISLLCNAVMLILGKIRNLSI